MADGVLFVESEVCCSTQIHKNFAKFWLAEANFSELSVVDVFDSIFEDIHQFELKEIVPRISCKQMREYGEDIGFPDGSVHLWLVGLNRHMNQFSQSESVST